MNRLAFFKNVMVVPALAALSIWPAAHRRVLVGGGGEPVIVGTSGGAAKVSRVFDATAKPYNMVPNDTRAAKSNAVGFGIAYGHAVAAGGAIYLPVGTYHL